VVEPAIRLISRAAGPAARPRRRIATLDFKFIREILSTMSLEAPLPAPPATPLSEADFHRLAHAALNAIEATVDRWLDDDVVDIDTHRTGGLLELSLPGGSKIILNTQPPLQELWLAAKAGGHHFRHVQGRWLNTRDSSEFFASVSHHLSAQSGQPLVVAAP